MEHMGLNDYKEPQEGSYWSSLKDPTDYFSYIPANVISYADYLPSLETLCSLPSRCVSTFQDYFVDGDKPWKQLKYTLSLKAIVTAFEKNKTPLCKIKEKYKKKESSELKTLVLNVIDILLEEKPQETPRARYRNFIDALRAALLYEKEYRTEYSKFLERICYYRFTELHFYPFCENLMHNTVKKGIETLYQGDLIKINEESKKELYQIPLDEQFKYIQAVPQSEKAPLVHLGVQLVSGGFNILFDAQRRGNVPYVLFDFVLNDKTVRVLRCGSPTMQRNDYASFTYEGEAYLTPEFENFVKDLKARNECLLFFSLQDNQERYVGTEKPRNDAFIELSKRFPRAFKLAIFGHDTPFYSQKAPFDKVTSATLFKMQFKHEILDSPESGFFFSEGLLDNADELKFREIIDEVHLDLYDNKQYLTIQERLNFIEVTYTRLELYLLKKSKADYLMNVCKDTIDRAAIRNALLHYYLLLNYKKENSGLHLNQLYTYLHAGAFLVKKRPVNERRLRFMEAQKALQAEGVKEKILLRKEDIGIQGDDILIDIGVEPVQKEKDSNECSEISESL